MSPIIVPLPKRPKPILPVMYGILSVLYTALAIYYFAAHSIVYGCIWGACSLLWWGFTFPQTIRSYRTRLRDWRARVAWVQRVNRINELIKGS
jgi:hypothetical protein